MEENILLPGRVAKLHPEETRRRLDRAYSVLPELKELAKRPAGSVSGGQGKMVALGRALMLGTRLLILDEPFQGLAPVLAQRYAEALRRLRSQDKDITLADHRVESEAARDVRRRDVHDRKRRNRLPVELIRCRRAMLTGFSHTRMAGFAAATSVCSPSIGPARSRVAHGDKQRLFIDWPSNPALRSSAGEC